MLISTKTGTIEERLIKCYDSDAAGCCFGRTSSMPPVMKAMEKVTGPLPQVIAHKTPFSECIAFTVVKIVPKREYPLRISLLHTVYDMEGGASLSCY